MVPPPPPAPQHHALTQGQEDSPLFISVTKGGLQAQRVTVSLSLILETEYR